MTRVLYDEAYSPCLGAHVSGDRDREWCDLLHHHEGDGIKVLTSVSKKLYSLQTNAVQIIRRNPPQGGFLFEIFAFSPPFHILIGIF